MAGYTSIKDAFDGGGPGQSGGAYSGGGAISNVANRLTNNNGTGSSGNSGNNNNNNNAGHNLPGATRPRANGQSEADYQRQLNKDSQNGGATMHSGPGMDFVNANPNTTISEAQYRQGKAISQVLSIVGGPLGLGLRAVTELQRRGILPASADTSQYAANKGGSDTEKRIDAILNNPNKTDAQKNAEITTMLNGEVSAAQGMASVQPLADSIYGKSKAVSPSAVFDSPEKFLQGMTLGTQIPTMDPNTAGTTVNDKDPRFAMDTDGLNINADTVGDTAKATTATADGAMASAVTADTANASTVLADTSNASAVTSGVTTASAVAPAPVTTYDAATTAANVLANGQATAQQGTVSGASLVKAEQLDAEGAATGMNKDGSINYTGVALNSAAKQGMQIIDTTTVAGRLLAQELGEGNYTDSKSTMQGQLDILSKQFVDATTGEPKIPSWATGVARNVSRIAAFKGMTGTAATAAMATAIMEASLPIAAQDATFFQNLTVTNLNNRQQMAVQKAQVLANLDLANLDARMTAAVENSKAFLAMDMANLNNRQQTEIINTQARVQSILEDARSENAARLFAAESQNDFTKFYDNLNSQIQQFNANSINEMNRFNASELNAISQFNANSNNEMSRFNTGELNATAQFNANATNEMNRFNTGELNDLSQFNANTTNEMRRFNAAEANDTSQFNANSTNEMNRFNVGEINSTRQFNATMENQREQFYKEMQYNIDLSNARWRQTVATTNTQMKFEAARTDVQNMVNLSSEAMTRMWDREDSLLDYAWKSNDNALDRNVQIYAADRNYDINNRQLQNEEDAAKGAGIFELVKTGFEIGDKLNWW